MDKVVKFLELYVQWIVLALAVFWVGWQGYSYLYNQPLTVAVGMPPKTVTPGEVDTKIFHGSTDQLNKAMLVKDVNAPRPVNVLAMVKRSLKEEDANPQALVVEWNAPHGKSIGGGQTGTQQILVTDLPHLPPAMPGKYTTRWTVIMVPAAPAAGAAAVQPVGGGAAARPAAVRQDVAYYSGLFTIDAAKLNAEINRCFSKNGVAPNLLTAEFVSVELLREEQNATGAWNPPVVLATLPIHKLMQDPRAQTPPLAPDKLKPALYNYKGWFEGAGEQEEIVHPAFYPTADGAEIWIAPGSIAPVELAPQAGQAPAERPFDPSRDVPRNAQEMRQQAEYRANMLRQQQQLQGRNGRPGAGRSGPLPGAANGPGYLRPRPSTPLPANPSVPPPLINPNAGAAPPAVNGGLPNQDIQLLVHDVSIQEGKTYRYAVRYKLFNPMWDHPLLAVANVAGTFDINSPDVTNKASLQQVQKDDPKFNPESMWTEAISVEPLSHIFVTHLNANTNQADFVVYSWKDGHWKEAIVKKLMPGDAVSVGKTSTPWTLVDVRKDAHSNEAYVILMDEHGVLVRRDEASDSQSPELQKLKTEGSAAAAAR